MNPQKVGKVLVLVCIEVFFSYHFVHFYLAENNETLAHFNNLVINTIHSGKRNEMSRLLNIQRQLYGQLNCELKALQVKCGVKVSCKL